MDHIVEDYFCNILLILISLKIYENYNQNISYKNSIKTITEKHLITPEVLQKFIVKNKSHTLKKSYKNPYNTDEVIFTDFIIKGNIQSTDKTHLSSKYNPKKPLVFRLNFKSSYYLNNKKTLEKDWDFVGNNQIHKEMINFQIGKMKSYILFQTSPILCHIYQNPDVQWLFSEEDKLFSKRSRYDEKKGFFKKIAQIFSQIFNFQTKFSVLGVEEKEFGLTFGSVLGVLGNIIYNYKEKSLRIEKPLYFFKDKTVLVNFLEKKLYESQKKIWTLGFFGIALLSWKIYNIVKNYGEEEVNIRNYFPGNEIYTNMDENLACPNCKIKTKNIVLMPCKHLSFCEDCYHLLKDREKSCCPCCKLKFQNFFKIYIV